MEKMRQTFFGGNVVIVFAQILELYTNLFYWAQNAYATKHLQTLAWGLLPNPFYFKL